MEDTGVCLIVCLRSPEFIIKKFFASFQSYKSVKIVLIQGGGGYYIVSMAY